MFAILFAALLFTTADNPLELDGVVTFRRGFDPYYFVIDDKGYAWRVAETNRPVSVHAGDRIHISGIVPKNTAQRRIEKAAVRKTGLGRVPSVRNLNVDDMYATALGPDDWYGAVLAVAGEVSDVNRRESYTQVLIGKKHRNVQVALPIEWNKPLPEGLRRGAIVRVQGVGVYTPVRAEKGNEVAGVENFCILPARFEDFQVISLPPFWTPFKVLGLCGAFFLALLAAVGWQLRKRRIERAMADATRRERLRLTGELHDNFQQLLAGCMFLLGAAQGKVEKGDTEAAKGQLARLRASLNHTQAELRAALWGLTEEAEGPTALTELFKYAAGRMPQWEGKVRFTVRGRERSVARTASGSLLLILLEAVGNALRHGAASHVDVVVDFTDDRLIFGVSDNGCGFDVTEGRGLAGHLGLENMRKHAEGLGGTLTVASVPGEGTTVTARIPL